MSSKRRLRRKQCTRKFRHATQRRAVAALISGKRAGIYNDRSHAYLCPLCSGWHVGREKLRFMPKFADREPASKRRFAGLS